MKIHIVKRGETLEKIAKRYRLAVDQLKEMNGHIKDGDKLSAGMKVKIPTASVPLKAKEAVPVSEQTAERAEETAASPTEREPLFQVPEAPQAIPEMPEMPMYDPSLASPTAYGHIHSFGLHPYPVPPSPGVYAGTVSPLSYPQAGAPCQPCQGGGGLPGMAYAPYPAGAAPFGMHPPMAGPAMMPPGEWPNYGAVQSQYDPNFFTQPHYPDPHHEQLYMAQAAQGMDCAQAYMPPVYPQAVSPYMMPPVGPGMMVPPAYPLHPVYPPKWGWHESHDSTSDCSSSSRSKKD